VRSVAAPLVSFRFNCRDQDHPHGSSDITIFQPPSCGAFPETASSVKGTPLPDPVEDFAPTFKQDETCVTKSTLGEEMLLGIEKQKRGQKDKGWGDVSDDDFSEQCVPMGPEHRRPSWLVDSTHSSLFFFSSSSAAAAALPSTCNEGDVQRIIAGDARPSFLW
jgi:hypothetical protein